MGDDMEPFLYAILIVLVCALVIEISLRWSGPSTPKAPKPDGKPRCKHGTVRPLQCEACYKEAEAYFNAPTADNSYTLCPDGSAPRPRSTYNNADGDISPGPGPGGMHEIPWQESAIWVAKDGREIPVNEMATSHLQNSIAMLDRRYAALLKRDDKVWELGIGGIRCDLQTLRMSLKQQGPVCAWPIYNDLVRELQKRLAPAPTVVPPCGTCKDCEKLGSRCEDCTRFGCKECY